MSPTFCSSNFLLGLILTNGKLSKKTLGNIVKTINSQPVVIYDLNMFDTENEKKSIFRRIVKLAIGYFVYLLPCTLIGYFLLFLSSGHFVCEKMNAQFLLNNSYTPERITSELYRTRIDDETRIGYIVNYKTSTVVTPYKLPPYKSRQC